MISSGERCYSNQYDEISYNEISDEISASRRIVYRQLAIIIWNRNGFLIKSYQHPPGIWGQMVDWKFFSEFVKIETKWFDKIST